MGCVFCNRDGPLTAEHIVPKWTRQYLGDPDDGEGTHTRIAYRAGESAGTERTYTGQPATQVVRPVCAECNNGWMAKLEADAKPFLESMICGSTRAYYDAGQTLIATWMVKTALVAGSKFPPLLPTDFDTALRHDQKPSANTRVWLARTPYDAHHQSDFRPIRVHDEDAPPPPEPNAFSALVVVGQLAGFVVSWLDAVPSTDRVLVRFGPALVAVWPLAAPVATWPPRGGALDFDQLDELANTVVAIDDVITGRGRPNA